MARITLRPGVRYLLKGQVYLIKKRLHQGRLLVENQTFPRADGAEDVATDDELYAAFARGVLRFQVLGRYARHNDEQPLATEHTIADLGDLPEGLRDEVWRRYQLILPLLRLRPEERTDAFWDQYLTELKRAARRAGPQEGAARSYGKTGTMQGSRRSGETGATGAGHALPTRGTWKGKAASRRTIARWLRLFSDSGGDLLSLVPESGGEKRRGLEELDPTVERMLNEVFDECRAHPAQRTIYDIYLAVVHRIAQENKTRSKWANGEEAQESTTRSTRRRSEGRCPLAAPSLRTIYRRAQADGIEDLARRRKSRLEAQAEDPVLPRTRPTRILERVEIDHTWLDLYVVDEVDRLPIGRPNLTFALDAYSGFPFGIYVGFEPASYRSVANCLQHGILPKADCRALYGTQHEWISFGLPETNIADNGREFTGRDLEDACGQLGIILERMPIKKPWFKGQIERFFRTHNTGLVHGLPGTTFSNILEQGDYDPFMHACISLSAFYRLLHIFLLDFYAERVHKGLKGIPARLWWQSWQAGFQPDLPDSAEQVRTLLGRTDERVVGRGGIEFENLVYQSRELMALRDLFPKRPEADRDAPSVRLTKGPLVRFKYDPGDLKAVLVRHPEHLGHWIEVPAVNQEYACGLSLWKHRVIQRYLRRTDMQVDTLALAAARAHIQRVVEEEFHLTRAVRRGAMGKRKAAARFLEHGTGPAPSTGSALPLQGAAQATPVPIAPRGTMVDAAPSGPRVALPALLVASALPLRATASAAGPDTRAAAEEAEAAPARRHRGRGRRANSDAEAGMPHPPTAPVFPDDDLDDEEGWGGDYDLPHR
jgi:putative transposase